VVAVDIIQAARDYSSLFSAQAIPDGSALRALSRIQKELVAAVVQQDAEAFTEWLDIGPLPADWEEGIVLPPHLTVVGADVIYDGDPHRSWRVSLLHSNQINRHLHMYPSVSVVGGKLILSDLRNWLGQRTGWEEATRLRLRIVRDVETLHSMNSPFWVPDAAEPALVASLAYWMAQRVGAPNLPALREVANASAQGWVSSIVTAGMARSWLIEVVE
jgi:hypothetical protein